MGIKLTGNPEAGSNRDAIGARVTVLTASGQQIRELDGGNSYCGQSDRRLFFGLGDEMIISKLEVRWPSRQIQTLNNVRGDQLITIQEPDSLPDVTSMIPTSRESTGKIVHHVSPLPELALPPEERDALLNGT